MVDPNPTIQIRGKNKSARAFREAQSSLRKLKTSATAVGLAFTAAAAAGAALVIRVTEQTRNTRLYSEALGVSTENLSRWEFAADRVGVSSDKVGDIMKDAADKIGDAYRNNAGEAKEAIESLGLDIENLVRMAPDQQLLTIAGALDAVGTEAERIQIAESIGNDLSLLLPLLENNAEGLQEMSARADELGVTLTSIEAANIQKADDAIKDMKASLDAMGQTLTAFVGPALADWLEDIQVNLPIWVRYAEDAVLDFGAAVMAAWEAMNPSDVTGSTSFADALVENQIYLRKLREEMKDQIPDREIPVYSTEASEEAQKAREQQQADELESIFAHEQRKMRAIMSAGEELTAWELANSEEKSDMLIGDAIATTRGVAHQSRALFEINKIAGTANAVINMHEGISKSLSAYPWPIAGAMAALHAVAGLAQIQAIQSASFGGSSAGGGFTGSSGPVPAPPSDFATAPNTNAPQGNSVQIVVEGNVFANDDWRTAIVEQFKKAMDNDELTDTRVIIG